MRQFNLSVLVASLAALCLSGCNSLHVEVGPHLAWQKVSTVALQSPPEDPWQLSTAIIAELHDMGLTVIDRQTTEPDLLVSYDYTEGPDLNADGDLLTRLKSLHIQFADPATQNNMAVADYFYADYGSEPLDGVKKAFAALRSDMQTASVSRIKPLPKADPQPQAEDAPPVTRQAPPEKTAESTQPSSFHGGQTSSAASVAEPAAATPPVTIPSKQPARAIVPTTGEPAETKLTPKTRSPWVPRFESWGFEDWGKPYDAAD